MSGSKVTNLRFVFTTHQARRICFTNMNITMHRTVIKNTNTNNSASNENGRKGGERGKVPPPTPPHTANAFAALEVEEAILIQPARRLDTQSERRMEEPTLPVARTNKTSGRKSQSRKKASADALSYTSGLSVR